MNTTQRTEDLPCRAHEPDLWFAKSPADLERAKQLCGRCAVSAACLNAALRRREPWGVWGGEILDQGVIVPAKRGRGRPHRAITPPSCGDLRRVAS